MGDWGTEGIGRVGAAGTWRGGNLGPERRGDGATGRWIMKINRLIDLKALRLEAFLQSCKYLSCLLPYFLHCIALRDLGSCYDLLAHKSMYIKMYALSIFHYDKARLSLMALSTSFKLPPLSRPRRFSSRSFEMVRIWLVFIIEGWSSPPPSPIILKKTLELVNF